MTATLKQPSSVTVVLPVLNEAQSVAACIDEAWRGVHASGLVGEVLVVDNGSTDGSAGLARAAGARVVREMVPGYGAALRRGIAEATGSIVVMADADRTYDLSRLGELTDPIAANQADVVIGGRLSGASRRTMPFLHRFVGTPILSLLVRRAAGELAIRDSQSGFRAIDAEKARRLDLKTTGMEFASEMLIRSAQDGLRIEEHDTGYRPRLGESKLQSLRDGIRHLQLIVLLAPHLLLVWPGLAMLGVGSAIAALSLANPLGFDIGTLRWQPIFFGPILIVLGAMAALSGAVIGHYSPLLGPSNHYTFVGEERFPKRCMLWGSALLSSGLTIDLVLFIVWLTQETSPARALSLAGIAQALIITGASLAGFGFVQRVLALRTGYRDHSGDIDISEFGFGKMPNRISGS